MDRSTLIHIRKKLNVTDLSGEKVMIDFASGKYFLIKGTGNDIWDLIQNDITIDEIIKKLLSEYDVSEAECEASVFAVPPVLLHLALIFCFSQKNAGLRFHRLTLLQLTFRAFERSGTDVFVCSAFLLPVHCLNVSIPCIPDCFCLLGRSVILAHTPDKIRTKIKVRNHVVIRYCTVLTQSLNC